MYFNFICIEGNIGIGKTTLVKSLSKHFKTHTLLEEFDENPWLPLFYKNPKETALALEISFLTDRSKQLLKIKYKKNLFCDYSLDKCLLFTKINLSATNFNHYKKLHAVVSKNVVAPDLVVVIHSNTDNLLANINRRNRSYEQNIQRTYLEKLNKSYRKFFKDERPYYILNIFTEDLSSTGYKKIFHEITSFLKHKPAAKISNLKL
jgi:deoxyguanosine kinase